MYYLRLVWAFIRVAVQQEAAYRSNVLFHLATSLLNVGTGIAGLAVFYEQVNTIHGWDFASVLLLMSMYLLMEALSGLCVMPSLRALAGLGGEIWHGKFDFTLLRPVQLQFFVSVRHWSVFTVIDVLFALGVFGYAVAVMERPVSVWHIGQFVLAFGAGLVVLYALMLLFAALIFWHPQLFFTWIFQGIFEMARFPVDLYPTWLRFMLTWIVPVGMVTTIPAQALSKGVSWGVMVMVVVVAGVMFGVASMLFRVSVRRYGSSS